MMIKNNEASEADLWLVCNCELIAKIIGECTFEEVFEPVISEISSEASAISFNQKNFSNEGEPIDGGYILELDGHSYSFVAKTSPWGALWVEPTSLLRNGVSVDCAAQFIFDARHQLGLNDINLANLLEELQNTLYSTVKQKEALSRHTASSMIHLDNAVLQSLLDGHPKLIANKGRLGWGSNELSHYAPESGQPVKLFLIGVINTMCDAGHQKEASPWKIIGDQLDEAQMEAIRAHFRAHNKLLEDYTPIPVHPWQWQRFIKPQYQAWIAKGHITLLGELPDWYLPQQSIRTLTNMGHSGAQSRASYDLKLPLTILNTSCYRGIPGKHISTGAELSQWLFDLISVDSLLASKGMIVQREICGVHCNHPVQAQIEDAPYRYHEMLGAVWRESLENYSEPSQKYILMATLMQKDIHGRALIAEYIEASGLTAEVWIRQLFRVVVIPLYHLMAKYGVGLVSHGQNISLVLDRFRPHRVAIKDFHGDLRIVDQPFPELDHLPQSVKSKLTQLPPHYLIHDLVTGHFVTTLRFISPLVAEQCAISEVSFYQILAQELYEYQKAHPELQERFQLFPLFEKETLRICVNRVRFRIGYGDSTERPLPELGQPLPNPLCARVETASFSNSQNEITKGESV